MKADFNMISDDKTSNPIHLAINNSFVSLEMISYLIQKKSNLNSLVMNPLHCALSNPNLPFQIIKCLVDNKTDLNIKFKDGNNEEITFLHLALKKENQDLEIIKLLVENKSDLNTGYDKKGTPLHFACLYQKKECIKYLIESRSDPNMRDQEGQTSFLYVAKNINFCVDTFKCFLENKCDPFSRDFGNNNNYSSRYSEYSQYLISGFKRYLQTFRKVDFYTFEHACHSFEKHFVDKDLIQLLISSGGKEYLDNPIISKSGYYGSEKISNFLKRNGYNGSL